VLPSFAVLRCSANARAQVALKLPEGNVSDADLSEILLKRKLKASSGLGWHVAEVSALCCSSRGS
jgi:hypothetical protein